MCHQIFASDTVVAIFTLFWVCVFKRRSSLGSTGTEYKIYVKNVVMFWKEPTRCQECKTQASTPSWWLSYRFAVCLLFVLFNVNGHDKVIIPKKSGFASNVDSNFIILVKPPLLVFRKSYLFVRCPFFVSHVCNFKISGPTKIAKTSLGCYRCYKVFFVPSNLYIRWFISRSWAPGSRSIQPCKCRCVIGA